LILPQIEFVCCAAERRHCVVFAKVVLFIYAIIR
jgi:hypothetical protein